MENYTKREITSASLEKALAGKYRELLDEIRKSDSGLDVQIRDNYLNVYYRGGSILKIRPTCLVFDEFYFYDTGKGPKKNVVKNGKVHKELIAKRESLLNILCAGSPEKYFDEAKKVMDEWIKKRYDTSGPYEREEQQELTRENTNNKESDYEIIDIEFAASRAKDVPYRYIGKRKTSKGLPHVPRFDIIAVRKSDEVVCVMELKRGADAISGESGLADHLDSFDFSVGRKDGWQAFVKDMSTLLEQKKEWELVGNVSIDKTKKPEFLYVLSYSNAEERKKIEEEIQVEVGKNPKVNDIPIIYLEGRDKILKIPK